MNISHAPRAALREMRRARRNAIGMSANDWWVVGGSVLGLLGLLGVAYTTGSSKSTASGGPPSPGGTPAGGGTPPWSAGGGTPVSGSPTSGSGGSPTGGGSGSSSNPSTPVSPSSPAAPPATPPTAPSSPSSPPTSPPAVPAVPPAAAAYAATDTVNDATAQNFFLTAFAALYQDATGSAIGTGSGGAGSLANATSNYQVVIQPQILAKHHMGAILPLRTDGVLDWRTWAQAIAESVSAVGVAPDTYDNTAITDPGELGLAQSAVNQIAASSSKSAQFGVIQGMTAAQGASALSSAIHVGTGALTYYTLAMLVSIAFNYPQ